nr:MAG TPA: hypothetical protein [Caudoviricetes sp.]
MLSLFINISQKNQNDSLLNIYKLQVVERRLNHSTLELRYNLSNISTVSPPL